MKRNTYPSFSEPVVRIVMIDQECYLISFRNVYGYLKTVLMDRCKKVGGQYCFYQKAYKIKQNKINQIKKQLEEVQMIKFTENNMKFKIQDFPMNYLKPILKFIKENNNKQKQSNIKDKYTDKNNNRLIIIDHLSQKRYFYIVQKLDKIYKQSNINCKDKSQINNQNNIKSQLKKVLFITSQTNKHIFTHHILKKSQFNNINLPLNNIELTFSQLTSKKVQKHQQIQKTYLLTYENLRHVESSWFLFQIKNITALFIDDGQFLIANNNQITSIQTKQKNLSYFSIILKNYHNCYPLYLFFSKLPQPVHLLKILPYLQPRLFTGLKYTQMMKQQFLDFQNQLTNQDKLIYEDYLGWFKKRYRKQNKCVKQIYYVLNNTIVRNLDNYYDINKDNHKVFQSLSAMRLFNNNKQIQYDSSIKLTLLQLRQQTIQKFNVMDKKYKKLSQSINLKQILESFHISLNQKYQQITTNLQNYQKNKYFKQYFLQSKQLMLSSKISQIMKKLYYQIQIQQQRIVIIIDDQKLQKLLKKYFKQTQINYVDYNVNIMISTNKYQSKQINLLTCSNRQNYHVFDSDIQIKCCFVNRNKIYKQYKQFKQVNQKKYKNVHNLSQNNKDEEFYNQYFEYLNQYKQQLPSQISFNKITSATSISYIDTFWNQFEWEKQTIINKIFNFQLSYVQQNTNNIENKQNSSKKSYSFNIIHKKPHQIIQNYYISQGSHEKLLLETYLKRKQSLPKLEHENLQEQNNLESYIHNLIIKEEQKYLTFLQKQLKQSEKNLRSSQQQIIQFLDIDQEYDKIEEQAKQSKYQKLQQDQKVFLPKYSQKCIKSFKEMVQEKLKQKNIQEIIQQSDEDQKEQKSQKQQEQNKVIQQTKDYRLYQKSQNQNIIQISKYFIQNNNFIQTSAQQIEEQKIKVCLPRKPQKRLNLIIQPQTIKITQKQLNNYQQIQLTNQNSQNNQNYQEQHKKYDSQQNELQKFEQLSQFFKQKSFSQILLKQQQYQQKNQIICQQKDLFDQLLGNNYFDNNFQYYQSHQSISYLNDNKKQINKCKQQQFCQQQNKLKEFERLKTKSQNIKNCQEQNGQSDLDKYLIKQQRNKYIQRNLQEFNCKRNQQISNNVKNNQQTNNNVHKLNIKKIIDLDNQIIQISQPYENRKGAIKKNKVNFLNKYRINTIHQSNNNKQFLSNQISKRKYRRKQYEQAVSKSKQLWMKKLKKCTQTLIISQKQLQIILKPKNNWKNTISSQIKQKLKSKGLIT